jgi:uncharacterized protein YabN with tetrapyrrole methylase and pyrophosphatase domain
MARLIVVGTGIQIGQISIEAREWLECADKVLYCVSDAATERSIISLNTTSESLYCYYGEGKCRSDTYAEMTARILECLKCFPTVVVAFYGHPGFFVSPSHRAVKLARELGHDAEMLPAVSSFDCLISDLGVNIASGCQIFEATDLMIRNRKIDTSSHLIILQVSSLGDVAYSYNGFDHRFLNTLQDYLLSYYPVDFEITSYYAAQFSVSKPRIDVLRLNELTLDRVKSVSTLYVPPKVASPIHLTRLTQYDLTNYMLKGRQLVPLNAASEDELL